MNFIDLYDNEKRSKCPKLIRDADNKIWNYDFKQRMYIEIKEEDVKCLHSVVQFNFKHENALKNKFDVIKYNNIIKNDICRDTLKLKDWNFDFVKIEQLIKFMVHNSIKEKIHVDDKNNNNSLLLQTIDEASGGGVLIAEKGTHEGKYSLYDINNSYNKFFLTYSIPSNPQFCTVNKISLSKTFRIYRLFIEEQYRTQEYKNKFKSSRKWFTTFDIEIFNMRNIPYKLVQQENNCITFDRVNTDFDWMETLNELKQNTDKETQPMKKNILKLLLSSVWGEICKYETQPEFTEDEEIPPQYKNPVRGEIDNKFYYNIHRDTGERNYINPNKIYKYATGIIKPFVLAFARLQLWTQINKLESKGCKVIFAHTDSIITDGKEKYFDIGSEIGQYKHEQTSEKGIIIKNIASKTFM